MKISLTSLNWLSALLLIISLTFCVRNASNSIGRLFNEHQISAIKGHDGLFYFFWLRSTLIDGDVDFRNDMELTMTSSQLEKLLDWAEENKTELGLVPNKYAVGWAVMNIPWFVAGHWTTVSINFFGFDYDLNGYSAFYQIWIVVGNIIYGFLGLIFCYLILRRFFDFDVALLSVVVVWSASSMIFYSIIKPNMSHHVALLLLAINYYYAIKLEEDSSKTLPWILIGISAGLLVITRFQCAVYLLFPAIICIKSIIKGQNYWGLVLAIVFGFICLFPQLLAWKFLYGEWMVYSYGNESFNWGNPQIYNVLFSPKHGWIYSHPMMLLGLIALPFFIVSQQKFWYYSILIIMTLVIYVNGSWHSWWFGASFGNRAFEGCLLFIMMGYGFLIVNLERLKWLKFFTLMISLALVAYNYNLFFLIVGGPLGMSEPLTFQDIIAATLDKWNH
ncbi:MAG: glycosyltransferase family 39 protein [Cyclobacteriaceae bacterium]